MRKDSILLVLLLVLPFLLTGAQDIRTPITLTFPDTFTGSGVFYGVTIYNDGDTTLSILNITPLFTGSIFQYYDSRTFDIPAYGSRTVVFLFEPVEARLYSERFNVNSNDPDEPNVELTVIGRGIQPAPDIQLSTSTFQFSTTVLAGRCRTGSPDFYNQGTAPLQITEIRRIGSPYFTYVGQQPPYVVPEGGTGELRVDYCPGSEGSHSAVFTICSNDPDEPEVSITFHGNAERGAAIRPPGELNFGDVVIGNSQDKTLSIYNDGSRTLTITEITYPAGDFSYISPSTPFDIIIGRSIPITIRFSPGSEGQKSSAFTIHSTDLLNPTVSFNAVGTGTQHPEPAIIIKQGGNTISNGSTVDFGSIKNGTTLTKEFIIENTGAAALELLNLPITPYGADRDEFSVSQQPGSPISPGNNTPFIIRFSPTSEGSKNTSISISSNDPDGSPYIINLTGMSSADPPTIDITHPANNATISGEVEIRANAASSSGVSYVEFQIGTLKTCTDFTPPYSCTWTPKAEDNGPHTIAATVHDNSSHTASTSIDVYVAITTPEEPAIEITFPNGGEELKVGSSQSISWITTATVGNVTLEYSIDNGSKWKTLSTSYPSTQPYPWTVPNEVSTQCLVKVSETDGSPTDTSNSTFSIIPDGSVQSLKVGKLTLNADSITQSGNTFTLSGNVNIDEKLWFSNDIQFKGNPDSGKGTLRSFGYPYVKLSHGIKPLFSGMDFDFELEGHAGTIMPQNLGNLVNYALTLANMPLKISERPITIVSEGVQIEPNLNVGNGGDFNLCTLRLKVIYKPGGRPHLKHAEVLADASATIPELKATNMSLVYNGDTDELTGKASLDFPFLKMQSIQATVWITRGCFDGFDISVALAQGIPLGTTGLEISSFTLEIDNLCTPSKFYIFFGGNLGITKIPDSIFALKRMGLGYQHPYRLLIEGGTAEFLGYPFATLSGYIDASGNPNKTGAGLSGEINLADIYIAKIDLQLFSMLLKFNGSASGKLQIPDYDCRGDWGCLAIKTLIEALIPLPYTLFNQRMDIDFHYSNNSWKGSLKGMMTYAGLSFAVGLNYRNGGFSFLIGTNYEDMLQVLRNSKRTPNGNGVIQSITLPAAREEMVFAAIGHLGQPEVFLETPTGKIITQENVGNYQGVDFIKSTKNKATLFRVEKAAAGNWELGVKNISDGEVEIEVLAKRQLPYTAFTRVEQSGNTVDISVNISEPRADTRVSFYFSSQASGGSGSPIAEEISASKGTASITWDTSLISTGTYYIFSKTIDKVNPPVLTYYKTPITINQSGIVPPGALKGSRNGSTVTLSWKPSTTPSVVGYKALYTDHPDIPGYKFQKTSLYPDQTEVENLDPGKHYRFCVVAFDHTGLSSLESNTYTTSGSSNSEEWLLSRGVAVSDSIESGNMKYYKIQLPSTCDRLEIKTANASGNIDLYLRRGRAPSITQYDYRASTASGNETIIVDASNSETSLTTGDWLIGIYGIDSSSYSVTADYTPAEGLPQIHLDRQSLTFGALPNHTSPPAQTIAIANKGTGFLNWTAQQNQGWIECAPTNGNNSATLTVSVNPDGLNPGTYMGTIAISAPNTSNSPQEINVTLNVYQMGHSSEPFGELSTPPDRSTVAGSLPVTGWVLDDIGVESVKIYRGNPGRLTYIGDAVFVEGARPDIEEAYPTYPQNYRSGWGYMMLTNFLPNSGNGTFKIHAIATDAEGQQATLGTKTIYCDNANAVNPFGAIDTPTQGGAASGDSFVNWGWVLTPPPNHIPTNGTTINVWVDGMNMGHPTYNLYRSDIAELFPNYANSNGAVGHFHLDTTSFENGVYSIQWSVKDSAGNESGIGSRFFTIQNPNSSNSARQGQESAKIIAAFQTLYLEGKDKEIFTNDTKPIHVCKGYQKDVKPAIVYPNKDELYSIELRELEPVEIHVGDYYCNGFQIVGKKLRKLPTGTTFDRQKGIVYWQPGPGFIGTYGFIFIKNTGRDRFKKKVLKITVMPKFEYKK